MRDEGNARARTEYLEGFRLQCVYGKNHGNEKLSTPMKRWKGAKIQHWMPQCAKVLPFRFFTSLHTVVNKLFMIYFDRSNDPKPKRPVFRSSRSDSYPNKSCVLAPFPLNLIIFVFLTPFYSKIFSFLRLSHSSDCNTLSILTPSNFQPISHSGIFRVFSSVVR